MKKTIILTGLLLFGLMCASIFDSSTINGTLIQKSYSVSITATKEPKKNKVSYERVNYNVLYKQIMGTVYHAEKSQCDNTPLITADNSIIDTARVNDLRWVALSRDLLSRRFRDKHGEKHVWSGKIKFGDTIWVDYDKMELWKKTHTNLKPDSITQAKNDLRYEKLKKKYEQIKGYWIVHDVMGKQYTKRNRKGELILDKDGNKQIVKIHNAIDFLQHPEYGMLDVWDRNIIIARRKVEKITLPIDAIN